VGVGVLPNDVDSPMTNGQQQKEALKKDLLFENGSNMNTARSSQVAQSSSQTPFTANTKLNSYYSLMEEEEEDENQYSTLISPSQLNQNQ
jgi:hypothetical protein